MSKRNVYSPHASTRIDMPATVREQANELCVARFGRGERKLAALINSLISETHMRYRLGLWS